MARGRGKVKIRTGLPPAQEEKLREAEAYVQRMERRYRRSYAEMMKAVHAGRAELTPDICDWAMACRDIRELRGIPVAASASTALVAPARVAPDPLRPHSPLSAACRALSSPSAARQRGALLDGPTPPSARLAARSPPPSARREATRALLNLRLRAAPLYCANLHGARAPRRAAHGQHPRYPPPPPYGNMAVMRLVRALYAMLAMRRIGQTRIDIPPTRETQRVRA